LGKIKWSEKAAALLESEQRATEVVLEVAASLPQIPPRSVGMSREKKSFRWCLQKSKQEDVQ